VSNSKYRNKQKQKVVKHFVQPTIVFTYTCTCHGERSIKKACSKGNGEPDDKGFFQSPLGTWTCPITRQKCKVNRARVKKEQDGPTQEASPADMPLSDVPSLEGAHAN
jgi:hypothetical protein